MGRLKSTGVHTPGGRSGALNVLPGLEAGFSGSGELGLRGETDLRRMTRVTIIQLKNTASKPPYKMAFELSESTLVNRWQ